MEFETVPMVKTSLSAVRLINFDRSSISHGLSVTRVEYEKDKDYTCESQKLKVKMSKVCDGVNDCPDASDEVSLLNTVE